MTVHLGLYGDVDLNLVDGSAVWLVSVAALLNGMDDVRTTLLLKAPVSRDVLTRELADLSRVALRVPDTRLIDRATAVDELEGIDKRDPFDAILLRGRAVTLEAARRARLHGRLWPYLTDIPQHPDAVSDVDVEDLETIANAADLFLCQTPELRGYLEGLLRDRSPRTTLLPPIVNDAFTDIDGVGTQQRRPRDTVRFLYAGKFAPAWGFLETVDTLHGLRTEGVDVELHVAGDKIHNPPDDPGFAPRVRQVLENDPIVHWHGALSRQALADLMRSMAVALSVRGALLDESLELSTKVLEYGACRLPVVLNRTAMHERLLGPEYPLFIDGLDDLHRVLRRAAADHGLRTLAAERCHGVARRHRTEVVRARLGPQVHRLRPAPIRPGRALRLAVAGHDLKFFRILLPFLERSGMEVRIDEWQGHNRHDRWESRRCLRWADVVVAEWCLGNAAWYSHRLRQGQRLLIRLHRQELETRFPAEVELAAVDRVIVVSDWMAARVQRELNWPSGIVRMISNPVDTVAFDRPKVPGAEHVLGMLGMLPWSKRLDRAVDLLEVLRRHDRRYRLLVGGALPTEVSWVWDRHHERRRFADLLDRIRHAPDLRTSVSFIGQVTNVPAWFEHVGVVLSPSDFEAFHLAVAEGMASRALPVIWDREGAAQLFDSRWCVRSTEEAADRLLQSTPSGRFEAEGTAARRLIEGRYSLDRLAREWIDLIRA